MSYRIGICRGGRRVSEKVRQSTVIIENPLLALCMGPECFSPSGGIRTDWGRLALFCGISLWM